MSRETDAALEEVARELHIDHGERWGELLEDWPSNRAEYILLSSRCFPVALQEPHSSARARAMSALPKVRFRGDSLGFGAVTGQAPGLQRVGTPWPMQQSASRQP
jgi:hypothetical protein